MVSLPPAAADYTHTLTVRYSECDAQGVVFNAHYQSLCDNVLDIRLRDAMGLEWWALSDVAHHVIGCRLTH